jgi:putative spermidine/putrescine transport system substrate-binding protein
MPDVVKKYAVDPFTAEHSDVKVTVEVSTAAESYPKMLAARRRPVISGGMLNNLYDAKGITDKMWAPFETSTMTYAADVAQGLNPQGGGLAMAVQGLGIAYNPTKVDRPTSWQDLLRKEYEGRVALDKGNFDVFVMLTHLLGGQTQDIDRGIAEFAKHKKNIATWASSPTQELQLLDQGDVWLAPMFSSPVITAKEAGQRVDFVLPEEGGILNTQILRSVDGFDEKTTRLTQELLNLHLSPDFQSQLVSQRRISPTSTKVEISEEDAKAGILSAQEAQEKLVPSDWQWLAEHLDDVRLEVRSVLGG